MSGLPALYPSFRNKRGAPLSRETLYILLAILSALLLFVGGGAPRPTTGCCCGVLRASEGGGSGSPRTIRACMRIQTHTHIHAHARAHTRTFTQVGASLLSTRSALHDQTTALQEEVYKLEVRPLAACAGCMLAHLLIHRAVEHSSAHDTCAPSVGQPSMRASRVQAPAPPFPPRLHATTPPRHPARTLTTLPHTPHRERSSTRGPA